MSGNKSFGKLYAKTFTGSLYGCGPVRLAVWAYAIANALPPQGVVELNPKMLSGAIGTDEAQTTEAIAYLCAPDPHSRNPEDEGRRLRHVSGFEYRLVNFIAHRTGTDRDARREYWKDRQRAHRQALSNDVKRSVIDSPGQSHKQKQKQKQSNTPSGGVGVCSADFESFWNCYPRKVAKQAAIKAFKAAISKTNIESMLKALATQKQSQQWQKDGGRFIPHPSSWLNGERWADDVSTQNAASLPVHTTGAQIDWTQCL